MIVKIQLSQFTTSDQRQMLVYNEDRSVCAETPATPDKLKLFGTRSKLFVHAEIDRAGILTLGKLAPWQEW